jgi:hypothetical protein
MGTISLPGMERSLCAGLGVAFDDLSGVDVHHYEVLRLQVAETIP